jgi:hypothetical protein
MSTWLYKRTEPELWTVGFYAPDGDWHPESDHNEPGRAAERVNWLNGAFSAAWAMVHEEAES